MSTEIIDNLDDLRIGDHVTAHSGHGVTISGPVANIEQWQGETYATLGGKNTAAVGNPRLNLTEWEWEATREVPEHEAGVSGWATVQGWEGRQKVMRASHSTRGEFGWLAATAWPVDRFGMLFEDDEVSDFVPDELGVLMADVERLRKKAEKWGSGDLPSGLTITLDGGVLNWRGENYVRQDTPTRTVVKVTKVTTHEELADALAQHYGDHDSLAAVGEPSTRQNYLDDAAAILALLGGESR